MENNEKTSDREKRQQRWSAVMFFSLIVWIISTIVLVVTDYESSAALGAFLVSCVVFWIGFASLLLISANDPWL